MCEFRGIDANYCSVRHFLSREQWFCIPARTFFCTVFEQFRRQVVRGNTLIFALVRNSWFIFGDKILVTTEQMRMISSCNKLSAHSLL